MAADTITHVDDSEALAEADASLSRILTVLEDLLHGDLEGKSNGDIERATLWMLDGFTSDVLLNLREVTSATLRLRSKVMGGLTADEHELATAVGCDDV